MGRVLATAAVGIILPVAVDRSDTQDATSPGGEHDETGVPGLVTGSTGAGKELAAQHFQGRGPKAAGPFVPVNCAAIPRELAERAVRHGPRRGVLAGEVDAPQGR